MKHKFISCAVILLVLFSMINPVFAALDQQNDYVPVTYSVIYNVQWVGQGFKAGLTGNLSTLKLYMYRTGVPDSTFTIRIYSSNSSSIPITLLTSQTWAYTVLGTTAHVKVTFDFDSSNQASLTTGNYYCWLVISTVTYDVTKTYNLEVTTSNTGYADGTICYSFTGGSTWGTVAYDESFQEYTTVPPVTLVCTFQETPKTLNNTVFMKEKTFINSETVNSSGFNIIGYSLRFVFNQTENCSSTNVINYALSFVFGQNPSGSGNKISPPVGNVLLGFTELGKIHETVTFYYAGIALLNPLDFLFRDGALFGFLIIIAVLVVIQAVSPLSCVITTPLSVLIALMYFKRFIDYPPPLSNEYLMWYGVFMSILAFILVIFRRKK